MTFNNLLALSPASAGLLAQVFPIFLLVFAIEGGKLIDPTRSGLRRSLAHLFRLVIVALQLGSIVACVVVVQLNQPSLPEWGAIIWLVFLISLGFLYLLINAVVGRAMLTSLDAWLTQKEDVASSGGEQSLPTLTVDVPARREAQQEYR